MSRDDDGESSADVSPSRPSARRSSAREPAAAPGEGGRAHPASLSEDDIEQALALFRRALRSKALRVTPVREAIVRAAITQDGHFDVEHLTQTLEASGVRDASIATVYRSMPLLVELGLVRPTMVTSGERRLYEAVFARPHHDHMICAQCGAVIEFEFEAFEMLQRELAAKYDFELLSHVHELIGTCRECRLCR